MRLSTGLVCAVARFRSTKRKERHDNKRPRNSVRQRTSHAVLRSACCLGTSPLGAGAKRGVGLFGLCRMWNVRKGRVSSFFVVKCACVVVVKECVQQYASAAAAGVGRAWIGFLCCVVLGACQSSTPS